MKCQFKSVGFFFFVFVFFKNQAIKTFLIDLSAGLSLSDIKCCQIISPRLATQLIWLPKYLLSSLFHVKSSSFTILIKDKYLLQIKEPGWKHYKLLTSILSFQDTLFIKYLGNYGNIKCRCWRRRIQISKIASNTNKQVILKALDSWIIFIPNTKNIKEDWSLVFFLDFFQLQKCW